MVDKVKIRHGQKWVTTSKTDILSDVPAGKVRYIVKVIATGDQQATRVLNLYWKDRDGNYHPFILNISVAAPEKKEIPEGGIDIKSPILGMEAGENIAGEVSGNSLSVTVLYWDDVG